jgi:glucose/arabinose transport system substrate-binding protein
MKPVNDEVYKPKKRKQLTVIISIAIAVIVIGTVVGYELTRPKVETISFYTWWATEGKVAVDKEYAAFHEAYPKYKVVSELKPGAGGSAAKYAILADIKAGHPPDTFQTHFGPEMLSYIEAAPNGAASFVNMTSVAASMGLTTSAFSQVLMAGTYNGSEFSLPVDVGRGALLYYNPQTLIDHHLPLPQNITTLCSDSRALEKDGISAWAMPGDDGGWDEVQSFSAIFLSLTNTTLYDEMMYGVINLSNPVVAHDFDEATSIFDNYTAMGYKGESAQTWTDAIPKIIDKQVGFQINGDWYTSFAYDYDNVSAVPDIAPYNSSSYITSHNVSLMCEPFPGTSHYFVLISDSVAVPSGATAKEGLTFAKFFSSFEGQKVFTKWKQSTFYNNITTDYYNTLAQWNAYETARNLSTNATAWVYSLSNGGLFDTVCEDLASSFLSTVYAHPTSTSTYEPTLLSDYKIAMSKEKSDWMTANKLGYGFMGTQKDPFGGYLPPWVGSSATPAFALDTSNITAVHGNSNDINGSINNPFGLFGIFIMDLIVSTRW